MYLIQVDGVYWNGCDLSEVYGIQQLVEDLCSNFLAQETHYTRGQCLDKRLLVYQCAGEWFHASEGRPMCRCHRNEQLCWNVDLIIFYFKSMISFIKYLLSGSVCHFVRFSKWDMPVCWSHWVGLSVGFPLCRRVFNKGLQECHVSRCS